MEYVLYIAPIAALLFGIFLYRHWKPVKRVNNHYTVGVFEEGRDPINDRTEFHFIKKG